MLTKSKLIFNKESETSFLHSNLRINQVDASHSGNYTCKLTNVGFIISSNAISVQVLNHGENPAAMNSYNSYNKHRALKDEFGSLLDSSAFRCLNTPLYLVYSSLLLYLLYKYNL